MTLDRFGQSGPAAQVLAGQTDPPSPSTPLAAKAARPYSGASGMMPGETFLQPSPEQEAILAARRADPAGSLRVLAFAGTGKTTALRLLAQADRTPALYLAYNKSTQLAAQRRFPAHITCRTILSLAFRATRMFEQQHRLARRPTGRELAELLAIPALDGLRPSFWGHC